MVPNFVAFSKERFEHNFCRKIILSLLLKYEKKIDRIKKMDLFSEEKEMRSK